ncbi:MAG TPA: hypothetical protein VFK03_00830 [Candidatus Saccharimonadales bacterium]|nr:hypothetical protein [Candidatus Saccharimonadales bacterium]
MTKLDELKRLMNDAPACAKLVGLSYVSADTPGLKRLKRGRGFSYQTSEGQTVTSAKLRRRIDELAIPPAWRQVWVCPVSTGHILATGSDNAGRKQYIYHPKWRRLRDSIKFYQLIDFGQSLPAIRRQIDRDLTKDDISFEAVAGVMLWLLDNLYIRIGHDTYLRDNHSVGLSTLGPKNVLIEGAVVTLAFKAKSGQLQQISFEDKSIAAKLTALKQLGNDHVFSYQSDDNIKAITANQLNDYLRQIAGNEVEVSAKDFRDWGGTLLAFDHLIKSKAASDKAKIAAVDQAAVVLGNTRSVARSSYVHPHVLESYGTKDFDGYLVSADKARQIKGLDRRENQLLGFLKKLLEAEFDELGK